MTEQLYYQDSYIKDFEAVVLSCIPNGNHFEAVLDRTAFFPEGGGQCADTGARNQATAVPTFHVLCRKWLHGTAVSESGCSGNCRTGEIAPAAWRSDVPRHPVHRSSASPAGWPLLYRPCVRYNRLHGSLRFREVWLLS